MVQKYLTLLLVALTLASRLEAAEANEPAVIATEQWLHVIDSGKYAKSWDEASKAFQQAITRDQWVAALKAVRGPLGKLDSRKLASSLRQTEVPTPGGKTLKGEFVISQFDASYQNLKYAIETVTFEKEPDGTWRASGYFIKPR